MTISFPAYHNDEIEIQGDMNALSLRVQHAILKCNLHAINHSNYKYSILIPSSWRSWGERIEITVYDNKVIISSRCSWFLQLYDWGKNKMNVNMIISALCD